MFQVCIKAVIGCLLAFSAVCASEQVIFKEGEHYEKLDPSILANEVIKQHISQDPDKIQVIEFFSYGCYWCSQVHTPLATWAKSKKDVVAIYHYPAVFNQLWRNLGRLYLTIQQLDNAAQLDDKIFQAIHANHVRAWEDAEIKKILLANNGNVETFDQYINSFVIASKLKKAEQLATAYKIAATPEIIIHGPHASYITSLSQTHDQETLINVINYLVMREQKFHQPTNQRF